jgi:hypothetical protein
MNTHFNGNSKRGGTPMFAHNRPFTAVAAGLVTALIAVLLDSAFVAAWAAQFVSAS